MKILTHDNIYIQSQTKSETKGDIWFLHGLGESSLSFRAAFKLLQDTPYNLYALDLPGFGASPAQEKCKTIKQLIPILHNLISSISQHQPTHLVAHSMSGIIATELCHTDKNSKNIKSIISIDGTIIINPDVAQRLTALSPENSVQQTIAAFYEYAKLSPAIMRYISSLNFTSSLTLHHFAQETHSYGTKEKSGARFLALEIPKLYIYGKQSWTKESVEFLNDNRIKTVGIDGGHWPMIDSPEECYDTILKFIESIPV